jgi:Family of unknown function (DUF6494)
MDEEALNTSVRKFLKKLGVTAQLPSQRHGFWLAANRRRRKIVNHRIVSPTGKLMSNQIELSAERLMKLEPEIRAALAAGPNEADTRLKVLDRFLFEILDWNRDSSVEAEPPTESGYIDYLLKIGENRGAMVVEAKRKGKLEPANKQSDVLSASRTRHRRARRSVI